jgi:hypothetical protein
VQTGERDDHERRGPRTRGPTPGVWPRSRLPRRRAAQATAHCLEWPGRRCPDRRRPWVAAEPEPADESPWAERPQRSPQDTASNRVGRWYWACRPRLRCRIERRRFCRGPRVRGGHRDGARDRREDHRDACQARQGSAPMRPCRDVVGVRSASRVSGWLCRRARDMGSWLHVWSRADVTRLVSSVELASHGDLSAAACATSRSNSAVSRPGTLARTVSATVVMRGALCTSSSVPAAVTVRRPRGVSFPPSKECVHRSPASLEGRKRRRAPKRTRTSTRLSRTRLSTWPRGCRMRPGRFRTSISSANLDEMDASDGMDVARDVAAANLVTGLVSASCRQIRCARADPAQPPRGRARSPRAAWSRRARAPTRARQRSGSRSRR